MTDTPEPAWQTQVEIEAVAQRFEEQIRRGDRDATIQAMLAAHRHLPRHGLFQALLESELDVRQPHASENDFGQQQYLARFPDLQSVVQAVFAKESSRQPSEDGLFTEPGDAADKARNTLSDLPQTPRYLTNPADVLSPGEEVGGYRIVRRIGAGSAGIVYLAVHQTTKAQCAVKILRADWPAALGGQFDKRFREEAAVLRSLESPRIVKWIESGEHDGLPYHVMQYVEGRSLRSLRERAPISGQDAARIVAGIADAIHSAHRRGVIHRDLKPSNVLLDREGNVFVSDFGIALAYEKLGTGNGFVGTPLYMSPEQAQGYSQLVDGRSDVFSLGVILYELLTGTHPFGTRYDTPRQLAEQFKKVSIPPLRQRAAVPRSLEAICLKALATDPADRYQTAEDFAAALRRYLHPLLPRRRRVAAASLVLLAGALSISVWFGVSRSQRPAAPQEQPIATDEPINVEAVDRSELAQNRESRARVAARTLAQRLRQRPASAPDTWDALRFDRNPTLQSTLVQTIAAEDVPLAPLLEKFLSSADAELRRTLVLCMAEYVPAELRAEDRGAVEQAIAEALQKDPNSGVHSACQRLLQRWQRGPDSETMRRLSRLHATADRQWYHTLAGQTMVVFSERLRGPSFRNVDFPEGHRFAIAAKELTIRQWRSLENPRQAFDDENASLNFPRNVLSWHDAALACNRLTDRCGYPPSEHCYEKCILADGREGYRAADDILQRRGFRMPTEAEWTYASHTGVSTRRHFGDDNRLLVHYANCRPASNDRLMEVGRLLPNRFGLFDTLGNVSEWLLDPHGVDDVAGTPPERYVIAGGSAFTPADGVYVDMDYHYPAAFAGQRVGLRVAQSLPAAEPGEMPFALAVDRPMAAEMPRMGEPRKLEYIPFADLAQPLPMGRFRRGSEPVRFLRISNLADRPIRLEHLIAEGRLSISSNAERVVPVGKSVQLEVTLDSSVPLDQVGLLHWQCRPEGGEPSGYALRVHGYAEGPMLHLIGGTVEQNRAAHVDFGKLPLGGVLRQTFSFFNNGDEPLTVELLEVAGAIQIRRREELRRIKPGAYAAIEVEVDTDTEQVIEGKIALASNDPLRSSLSLGLRGDVRPGKRTAVLGMFRGGQWSMDRDRDGTVDASFVFGESGDIPLTGDFDGDGECDFCVCRIGSDGTWHWHFRFSSQDGTQPAELRFGTSGDIPLAFDRNGDGRCDLAIVRPVSVSDQFEWRIDTNRDGEADERLTTAGSSNDIPVAGDWDGGGSAAPGLYRPGGDPSGVSTWTLYQDGTAGPVVCFGLEDDIPIAGDWNGDGQTDIGVCRDLPAGRILYLDLNRDREPEAEHRFGRRGDRPVVSWEP